MDFPLTSLVLPGRSESGSSTVAELTFFCPLPVLEVLLLEPWTSRASEDLGRSTSSPLASAERTFERRFRSQGFNIL